MSEKILRDLLDRKDLFSGHYIGWRAKRLAAILAHYGPSFFLDKTLLEVGCGYGDIGSVFARIGSHVTCSDARAEHLEVVRWRYPEINTVRADLDLEWPFDFHDILIHMGVLYHLSDFARPLEIACRSCNFMVLETEVADSDDPACVLRTDEEGFDQAAGGKGVRPSAAAIEAVLISNGMKFERISDDRCNFDMHRYDWPVTNTNTWNHGLRRFWFVERVNGQAHEHGGQLEAQRSNLAIQTIQEFTRLAAHADSTGSTQPQISSDLITVVVQGPVIGEGGEKSARRLTHEVLQSIRRVLPEAQLILSTWKGSPTAQLSYDILIESEDPGSQFRSDGRPCNINRQIVSTQAALERTTRPFVLKIRTDCILVSNSFLRFWNRFPERAASCRLFQNRIIGCELYFRSPAKDPNPFLFHISDIVHFGLADDLRALWGVELATELEISNWHTQVTVPFLERTSPLAGRYTEEQHLWITFLKKHGIEVDLNWASQYSPELARLSELSIVNNFVILSSDDIGICFPSKLMQHAPEAVYHHSDWLELYEMYCQGSGDKEALSMRLDNLNREHRHRVWNYLLSRWFSIQWDFFWKLATYAARLRKSLLRETTRI